MKRVLLCLSLLAVVPTAVNAGQRRAPDQSRAREMRREGGPPLRDIQRQWHSRMPGYDYLGSDYDPGQGSYRLKYMRDGSVSWVDVDGRTGREVGRSPQ
ncbi:hypothetical protein [Sphingomonas abietis]|uniref:PepSY domain-containing protein n=1 Tax=Sphingomonas abietis TaxID=3012344 RepID=A0ABY7NN41_9SPHN|nr:hypothetical protein [Sphingomonas abietis]WBO21901.1 hypothetical protein PBT88_17305 [Sphingomonas abietis]